ncbi:DnaJ-related protein SCJ1 [Ceratocystis lukuohia]|uniref:DnaJ-related protein SCJ1 n=2 Tax=Ceratocystis TaxID=5157 RepID=A0A0F8BQT4_CERFI|nr:DnaJ-related protein SCJ1 [Ceratocystis platani]
MLLRATFLLLLIVAFVQLAVCAEDYYKVLKVGKNANDKQLKSAYRQLSKRYHPDKNNGDEEAKSMFVQISEAYEVLSDPETRKIYDKHGHDGIKRHKEGGGHQGGHDPFDLFSRFFGGGGHFDQRQRRGSNAELRVGVSLRDFYNGIETELQWEKQHICEECAGSGSSDGKVETCPQCQGHGVRIRKQFLAPGMYQQIQVACDMCSQRGKIIKNKCKVCNGSRVVRKPTPFTLKIDRGAKRDSRIVYENEADADPDWVAGDLILTLTEKAPEMGDENPDHVDGTFFRRRDDDLYWNELLSLREAWMGDWTRNLTHLDGHIVQLKRGRGEVVQPGHVEKIPGEGMPIWHEHGDDVYHKTEFGNLYIEYTVVLPDQMDEAMEKDFFELWEKWRGKIGVNLDEDAGRPAPKEAASEHDEL